MTTDHQGAELKPCPFCGAGQTTIEESRMWTGMRYGEPISVSVRHWCEKIEGQPSRMIERIGRDRESAIAAWNRRAPNVYESAPKNDTSAGRVDAGDMSEEV